MRSVIIFKAPRNVQLRYAVTQMTNARRRRWAPDVGGAGVDGLDSSVE